MPITRRVLPLLLLAGAVAGVNAQTTTDQPIHLRYADYARVDTILSVDTGAPLSVGVLRKMQGGR